ncbi:MAG: RDD family protein [Pseudomonadota bacterium]
MKDFRNPYQPPKSAILPERSDQAEPPVPVGRGRRFFNYLIDLLLIYVSAVPVGVLLFFVLGEEAMMSAGPGFEYLVGITLIVGYYSFFEGLFAWTPGKLVTGTRVVNEDGDRPSFGQILGRSLTRVVPLEPFSMFSSTRRAWHDRWPATVVISVRN